MAIRLQKICSRQELEQTPFLILPILYKNQSTSAIIFCYEGETFAFINNCMHMHKPLNCQEDTIFDTSRRYLRCSMHGFLFNPQTGECQSPVCEGEKLQPLKLHEQDDYVFFAEKHLILLNNGES